MYSIIISFLSLCSVGSVYFFSRVQLALGFPYEPETVHALVPSKKKKKTIVLSSLILTCLIKYIKRNTMFAMQKDQLVHC